MQVGRRLGIAIAIILVLATAGPARAAVPHELWARQFGTPDVDFATAVDTDHTGEVSVLACQRCFSSSDERLVVRRYDSTGNLLWKQSVAASADHQGHELAVDNRSGDIYVVGYVYRAGLPAHGPIAFVAKIDRVGRRQWERQFATSSADGVGVRRDGTVFVVGASGGTASVTTFSSAGAQGATLRFGPSEGTAGTDVGFDAGGSLYVAGTTKGAFPGQTDSPGTDAFVAKFGGFGTQLWARQFGPGVEGADSAPALAVDRSGRAYVGGMESAGNGDAYVRAYDTAGAWLWQRDLGTTYHERVWDIDVDKQGNVYVGGVTYGALADPSAHGGPHALVATYDPAGTLRFITQFEPPDGAAIALGIALGPRTSNPQSLYVAGAVDGAFAGQQNRGNADNFVLRLR